MNVAVLAISFDAHNAADLAQFWARALHRTVDDGATEDFAAIAADNDSRISLRDPEGNEFDLVASG